MVAPITGNRDPHLPVGESLPNDAVERSDSTDPVSVPLSSATDTSVPSSMAVSSVEQDEIDAAAAETVEEEAAGFGETATSHPALATELTLDPLTTPPTGSTSDFDNDSPVGINSGVTVTNHPINKSAKQPPPPFPYPMHPQAPPFQHVGQIGSNKITSLYQNLQFPEVAPSKASNVLHPN